MSAPPAAGGVALVVTGAGGRLGRVLRQAWAVPPEGLVPLWQSRRPRGPDWIAWGALPGRGLEGGVMVHLAGATPTGGGDAAAAPDLALAALAAAREAGLAHVFLASSAAVYGVPGAAGPVPEDAPLAAAAPYGAGKRAMEDAARRWHAAAGAGAPGVTSLRIGNVAGTDALADAVGRAGAGAPLVLDRFPDGATPRRSYVGPESLAAVLAALARAAAAGRALPEALNLAAPGPGVEMGALLDALGAAGRPVPVVHRPAGPGALRALVLDTDRLQALAPLPAAAGTPAALAAEWRAAFPDL